MATFLDVTGLRHFTSVFVFLFVWIVIYAILLWSKVLGDNKVFNAIVGLLFGIFVLISPTATNIVAGVAPFVAVALILIMLVSVASKMLGGEAEGMHTVKAIFSITIVFIVIATVGVNIRESVDVDKEVQAGVGTTLGLIFNPTFLGMLLLFGIAIFTVALLASGVTGGGGGGH